jgi:hypothetical protein
VNQSCPLASTGTASITDVSPAATWSMTPSPYRSSHSGAAARQHRNRFPQAHEDQLP